MDTTNLANKRKEADTLEETPPTKKLSRQARARGNKKQRREQVPTHHEPDNIVFNPNRHQTQNATCGLCTHDKVNYIEKEWISVPLCSSDRKSSKETKTQQEISTKDLLIESLIREAKPASNNSLEIPELPPDFLTFLSRANSADRDIVNGLVSDNNGNASEESEMSQRIEAQLPRGYTSSSVDNVNKKSWITFGRWLGFREPIKRRTVRRHLKNLWGKFSHALDLQEIKDQKDISNNAITYKTQRKDPPYYIIT